MRLVFAGTPSFAVPTLASLRDAGHDIVAVYSQPPKPAGRGKALRESPVGAYAQEHGLELRQPPTLKQEADAIAALAADAMIVVAYGLLLPPEVLRAPRLGCINVHASLLPRWRGAAPIQRAIEAGDTRTGVSIMQMERGLDTGPVFLRAETPIGDTDSASDLHDRLAVLGAATLVDALAEIAGGRLRATPQAAAGVTYAAKLSKAEALLDWQASALTLARRVRAFNPWPVAYTHWRAHPLRVWGALPLAQQAAAPAGTILACDAGIVVATGDGALALTDVQLEGGRRMTANEFLRGHRLEVGERLA